MKLAIDFDHTICDTQGQELTGPLPDAQAVIGKLKLDGHKIIVHSHRAMTDFGVKQIEEFMQKWDIPYDRIEPKPNADVYIDDKGYHFENWRDTLDYLDNSKGS